MKFPLHLLLTASAPLAASAYLSAAPPLSRHRRPRPPTRLHYKEPSSDGKSGDASDRGSSDDASSVWSVLASTERWISDTLDRSNQAARQKRAAADEAKKKLHFADEKKEKEEELPRVDNPYARKEVSYVCETGTDLSVVVGSVFRRVREARELGENHGRGVEARGGEFLGVPSRRDRGRHGPCCCAVGIGSSSCECVWQVVFSLQWPLGPLS